MASLADILKNVGLYNLIRYSSFYQFYQKRKYPLLRKEREKDIKFLKTLIPSHQLVFDIGANNGEYSEMYLQLGSRVVAVDPDLANVEILEIRFRRNRNLIIVGKAVSNMIGTEQLFINGDGSGFNTMSEKWKSSLQDPSVNRWKSKHEFKKKYAVETITLDKMISQYGLPYLIKIDIEGYELKAISSLHKEIALINFEANLPEFREETIMCIEHLLSICYEYTFNVCDGHTFIFSDWKDGIQFSKFIKETNRRYLDIWVRHI